MNLFKRATVATIVVTSLQMMASVDNAAIGYEVISVSRDSETELSTFTIEWAGLDASLWGAYVHNDYRPDEYDDSKVIYTLDVKRNGKSVTRCSPAQDIDPIYSPYSVPLHYRQEFTLAEPQTKGGTYTIELPRGLISDAINAPYAKYINDETTITFVIEGDGGDDDDDDPQQKIPEGEMALVSGGPSVDNIPDSIETIVWEWTTAAGDNCLWFGTDYLEIKDSTGDTVARAKVSNRENAEGKWNIILSLDLPIEITGRYKLTIPAGAIANNADKAAASIFNEATTLEYAVLAPSGFKPDLVYPADNARLSYLSGETMESISVNYLNAISLNHSKTPFLFTEDGVRIYADNMSSFLYDSNGGFVINFIGAKELPTGKYILIIPRGTVVGGEAIRVNYYWEEKPAEIVREDPLELLKAEIDQNGGSTFNLLDTANGIDYIQDQSYIRLSTNYDDICDAYYYRILDVTGLGADFDPDEAEPLISNFAYSSAGFSSQIYGPQAKPYKLSADREYMVAVECYSNYQTSMRKFHGLAYGPRFRGGAKPYEYSTARLLKVEPAPGGELTASDKITLAFDQPVEFSYEESGVPMGQQGSERMAYYEPNADKTVWTFGLSASSLEKFSGPNSINIRFAFNDAEGKRVRPAELNVPESDNVTPLRNMGTEGGSTICVWYGTFEGCALFNVNPAPESTVKSLYEFEYTTTSHGGELNPSWLSHIVNLTDSEGNTVASMVCDKPIADGGNVRLEQTGSEDDPKTVKVKLHLDSPVTAHGTYQLSYPYAYFAMGREMDSAHSKPATHLYTVYSESTQAEWIPAEEETVEIYTIEGYKLGRGKYSELKEQLKGKAGIYLIVGDGKCAKSLIR